jgi:SAM-dependent methyltransferase
MTCGSCDSSSPPARAAQYDAIAELYDGYPGNYLEDIVFFAEEATRAGSPVLEIGVGSGRLAFCLAAVGLDVVGIDSSVEMLRALERKRAQAGELRGRVDVLAGDMRRFSLRPRCFGSSTAEASPGFPLAIIAFRTFLYLLTKADQRRALRCVRRHLSPGGLLAMSFFVPPRELLARGRTEAAKMTRFPAPDGSGEVIATDWAEFLPARQRVISHITYEWRDGADRPIRQVAHDLVARYVFPEEVPPLLESCGLEVVEAYGGFDRRPLTETSREQIWLATPIAKKRGS